MIIIYNLFILARPKQWLKNIFVFAALIFAVKFFDLSAILKTILGFIAFCLTSSSIYIINDICDKEKDRLHPQKKNRPLAADKISVNQALIFSIVLLIIGLIIGYLVSPTTKYFLYSLLFYFAITCAYSFYLKNFVILDVIIIAIGFVIRAIAGAFIINVEISNWLLFCSFLLALLIGFGKRRNELITLGENANSHRKNLKEYTTTITDYFILIISSAAIIAYSLYCMSERTRQQFHTDNLKYTIPFVVYGILRYIYIIIYNNEGGEPENLLLKDKGLLINFLLWTISIILIIALYR